MDSTFVARQPIFDRNLNVHGYELLYRANQDNFFPDIDGDQASSEVIGNSVNVFGFSSLVGPRRAFINVTRKMLVENVVSVLPKKQVILEILESVEPDDELIGHCQRLREEGFRFAMDDFEFRADNKPLWSLVDYIKIDFIKTPPSERKKLAMIFRARGVRLVAEKVESYAEVREARDQGYGYFQGYFFSKPQIVERKDVPGYKANYLRLLSEINRPDIDFGAVENVVKQDVGLSVKLMRYINSVSLGFRQKIDSIKHALVLLGHKALQKWVSIVAFMDLGEDRPKALLMSSLVRARLLEKLAGRIGQKDRSLDYFMLGMFSTLDAVVGRPMEEILLDLPVAKDVRQGLLTFDGPLGLALLGVRHHEQGEWEQLDAVLPVLGVEPAVFNGLYREAVDWTEKIFVV